MKLFIAFTFGIMKKYPGNAGRRIKSDIWDSGEKKKASSVTKEAQCWSHSFNWSDMGVSLG